MAKHWWYPPVFALISWVEASIELLFLGQIGLQWSFKFAAWYTKRNIRNRLK